MAQYHPTGVGWLTRSRGAEINGIETVPHKFVVEISVSLAFRSAGRC